MKQLLAMVCLASCLVVACSGDDSGCEGSACTDGSTPSPDGDVDEIAPDSQVDETAPDSSVDEAPDADTDGSTDSSVDETPDAELDSSVDEAPDAAPDADVDLVGPTAGFTLSKTSIDVPATVTATSTASAGDGAITAVAYDWGSGFEAATSHQFSTGGTHVVRQRVTDDNGLSATTMLDVSAFRPVRLSTTDKSSHVTISADGLVATQINVLSVDGGVRSDTSIAPGSGVFYFEATRVGKLGYYGYGVGTATTSLSQYLGSNTTSIGANTLSHTYFNDVFMNGANGPTVGFVVDYRGASPIVHILSKQGDDTVENRVETLAVTTPVFAMYTGMVENHGPCAAFNFGSDTTNHPFVLNPAAALNAAGHPSTATALVRGFGQTRARTFSAAPMLSTSGDMSGASGTPVTLTATATDAEDGVLTAGITWENLATSIHEREHGTGGSFTFTPPEIGKYPIRVTVKDSFAVETTHTIMIQATGTLPQFDPVRLVADDQSGEGITLSSDGLRAVFSEDHKMGIHANQPMYGRFWYFEMQRLIDPPENIGGGMVIEHGSLNPMLFETMHPSLQINFSSGLWHDLVHEENIDTTVSYYGYAVDYRGDNPIVYVIIENEVAQVLVLDDVWVPLYPMLYGNRTGNTAMYDSTINFGVTAFHNDPVAALIDGGYSTAGLELGWGEANLP
jgi:hypothetical protein